MPSIGKLIVANTVENLTLFEKVLDVLNVVPCQIEIEVQFVAFNKADIAKLAATGMVDVASLNLLRQQGRGDLLAAPKVVTQSGAQAAAKGVRECIYPTSFSIYSSVSTNTNDTAMVSGPSVEPGDFETREVGAILQVLPEVTSDGSMINLTMTPQYVSEPVWRNFGGKYTDVHGKEQVAQIEMPFFHTEIVTTSVSIADGETILFGGGLPDKDNSKFVYTFVTARRIGMDGKVLKPRQVLLP